jgi:hypothetical protein
MTNGDFIRIYVPQVLLDRFKTTEDCYELIGEWLSNANQNQHTLFVKSFKPVKNVATNNTGIRGIHYCLESNKKLEIIFDRRKSDLSCRLVDNNAVSMKQFQFILIVYDNFNDHLNEYVTHGNLHLHENLVNANMSNQVNKSMEQ